MSKKKIVIIIAVLILFTFGNCLTNDFIGDAKALFTNNPFYKNPKNIVYVFHKDFNMDPARPLTSKDDVAFSGCISYRPVTAITFFIDYFIWKANPFGHHLSNIIMHIICSFLVFLLIAHITGNSSIAFLAALLFSVHPIHSEVVNNIGYRSDLLAVMFYLLTFVTYIKFRIDSKGNIVYLLASFISFFIALFSKETALTLPLLLYIHDFLFLNKDRYDLKTFLQKVKVQYSVFMFIGVYYCYIYFFVMPSQYYPQFFKLGTNIFEHVMLILKIFFNYLVVLIIPHKVSILPPMYAPPISSVKVLQILSVIVFLVICCYIAIKSYKKEKVITFGWIWFLVTYLPASNILPLPNPYAFRFMYLPSIGFFMIFSVFLDKLLTSAERKFLSKERILIAKVMLIGLCISAAIPNNSFFKNNIVACKEMIRNYPDSSRPYWILGLSYFDSADYDKAVKNIKEYLKKDVNNSFLLNVDQDYLAHHMLGRCYVNNPDKAIEEFRKSIQLKPDFVVAYVDLAKTYIVKQEYESGLKSALYAIAMNERFVDAYVYAVHSCIELGQYDMAEALLNRVLKLAPDDTNVKYVSGFYKARTQ